MVIKSTPIAIEFMLCGHRVINHTAQHYSNIIFVLVLIEYFLLICFVGGHLQNIAGCWTLAVFVLHVYSFAGILLALSLFSSIHRFMSEF